MLTTLGGSVENGVAGKYDLHIKTILEEAWQKTQGFKKTFWSAIGLMLLSFAILIVVESVIVFVLVMTAPAHHPDKIAGDLFNVINNLFWVPFNAAVWLLAIRQVSGQAIQASLIFHGWQLRKVFWNLMLSMLILYVFALLTGATIALGSLLFSSHAVFLKILGIILCVFAGLFLLYFVVAYTLAKPLIIERDFSAWQAFLTSVRAVTQHWFKMFGIYWVVLILTLMGIVTLGIGFIWIAPMTCNIFGICYREILGAQIQPLESFAP